MTAEQILVIYLSVALAVFLSLGIVFLVFAIQIVKQVQRITQKAEDVITTAGETLDQLHNATTFAMVGNVLNRVAKVFSSKHNDKKD